MDIILLVEVWQPSFRMVAWQKRRANLIDYFFLLHYTDYILATLHFILLIFSFYYFLPSLRKIGVNLNHKNVVVVSKI